MRFTRFAITLSVLLYTIAVPVLEINDTHVFNSDWTPHVRIHEVWQLITNSSLGVLCLWLTWKKGEYLVPSIISLLITGGFLLSYLIKNLYGGSMKYLDGSEKVLFGVNIGVLGFGIAVLLLALGLFLNVRNKQ
ncbi:hypothetical protein [Roseivirga sp.]|uniref:hypothetical protein n=1 Tax=Roseivirga sp. TaxID=1964215 RepID=UPI003B52CC5D